MGQLTREPRGPGVDADDFADLFHIHAARLVRLAALLGDPDPEDAVQEAFCKVYVARGGLRRDGNGNVVGYLNRTVVNLVRDRHRRVETARSKAHLVLADRARTQRHAHAEFRSVVPIDLRGGADCRASSGSTVP